MSGLVTTADAIKALRNYDGELTTKQRAAIADILDEYSDGFTEVCGDLVSAQARYEECAGRLCIAFDALRDANMHLCAGWCWCNPEQDSANHWVHKMRESQLGTKEPAP